MKTATLSLLLSLCLTASAAPLNFWGNTNTYPLVTPGTNDIVPLAQGGAEKTVTVGALSANAVATNIAQAAAAAALASAQPTNANLTKLATLNAGSLTNLQVGALVGTTITNILYSFVLNETNYTNFIYTGEWTNAIATNGILVYTNPPHLKDQLYVQFAMPSVATNATVSVSYYVNSYNGNSNLGHWFSTGSLYTLVNNGMKKVTNGWQLVTKNLVYPYITNTYMWFQVSSNGTTYPIYANGDISLSISNFSVTAFTTSAFGSGSSAATVTYSSNATGLSAASVQEAIDQTYGFAQTNNGGLVAKKTVVVVNGDSKSVGIGQYLLQMSWFANVAYYTNIGVISTSLNWATNCWNTNETALTARIGSGTNGVYILWSMANDVNSDPWAEITTLSNHLARVSSLGWMPIVLTVQPRASSSTDNTNSHLFLPVVNNWIRGSGLAWRVADAGSIMQNCYDLSMYSDSTHPTAQGYSNVANLVMREIDLPVKAMYPEQWSYLYGTNYVTVTPGTNQNAHISQTLY